MPLFTGPIGSQSPLAQTKELLKELDEVAQQKEKELRPLPHCHRCGGVVKNKFDFDADCVRVNCLKCGDMTYTPAAFAEFCLGEKPQSLAPDESWEQKRKRQLRSLRVGIVSVSATICVALYIGSLTGQFKPTSMHLQVMFAFAFALGYQVGSVVTEFAARLKGQR